ncbi:MAG: septal ring lytic transglycosylase RlpA family protein [Nitrospiria bacterium]
MSHINHIKTGIPFFYMCILTFILNACVTPVRKRDYPIGYREVGFSSWYGKDFHGRPTASGEIYNMFGITAAHRTLPLGTLLRVIDLTTGRYVNVKVNDRGPFIKGRILDLSYGAAKRLDIVSDGIAKVEIEIIGRAPIVRRRTAKIARFTVQVGAYQSQKNAIRVKSKVAVYYQSAVVEGYTNAVNEAQYYRVRIGTYASKKEALLVVEHLKSIVGSSEDIAPMVIPVGE